MEYRQFNLDRSVLYADMNVYRYIAYGELKVQNPELAIWTYSSTHLDEIYRNGNTDALEGIRILKAREVIDNLDENFKSVGNITLNDYIDPFLRYEKHLDAIEGSDGSDDLLIEFLIRALGADNFKDLELKSDSLPDEIDRLTEGIDDSKREELRLRARETTDNMREVLNTHLVETKPIDETRNEMGIKSNLRKEIEASSSPIDKIWGIVGPSVGNVSKEQFFGFEPNPAMAESELQHTQHGSIGGVHIVLNMLGYSPDKGLNKKDKIRNIIADGQHVGMASYCNGVISADKRFINKARVIYGHEKINTAAIWFEYKKEGITITLGQP